MVNTHCPCGSGKEYHMCCFKSDEHRSFDHEKNDKILQMKGSLESAIFKYVYDKMGFPKMKKLEAQFKNRLKAFDINLNEIQEDNVNFSFRTWVNFYHVYENGKRAIEWFFEENENVSKWSKDEQDLLKVWLEMKPAILQLVNQNDEGYWYEDCVTQNQYFVSRYGSTTNKSPWSLTYALIGPNGKGTYELERSHCFSPIKLRWFLEKVNHLAKEALMSFEDALISLFPEIVSAIFAAGRIENEKMIERKEWTLIFRISEPEEILRMFELSDRFVPEYRMTNSYYWVKHWCEYKDNASPYTAYLGHVAGSVLYFGEILSFRTLLKEELTAFEGFIHKKFRRKVELLDRVEEKSTIPYTVENGYFVTKGKYGVPPEFLFQARSLWGASNLNQRIDLLDKQSLNQLIKNGQEDIAEIWLRESEYCDYREMKAAYPNASVTPDYNSIRRKLGLPESPFVTNAQNRVTSFTPTNYPPFNELKVTL